VAKQLKVKFAEADEETIWLEFGFNYLIMSMCSRAQFHIQTFTIGVNPFNC